LQDTIPVDRARTIASYLRIGPVVSIFFEAMAAHPTLMKSWISIVVRTKAAR